MAAVALAVVMTCSTAPSTVGAGERLRAGTEGPRTGVAARRGKTRYTRALLRVQNAQRRAHGLRRLRVNRSLSRAARRHARDMVRRHYFGHVSRGGRDVVDRVARTRYGRGRFAVQENLYWWSRRRAPGAVVRAWLGSAPHRANVLGARWRQVGVAAVPRSPYGRRGVTVVAVYGTRR